MSKCVDNIADIRYYVPLILRPDIVAFVKGKN